MTSPQVEARHVLLIQCTDETGLVHKVTGSLFGRKLNITENAETVDLITNTFFMRTEFLGDFDRDTLLHELKAFLPAQAHVSLNPYTQRNVVLFATRESHCLGDILLRNNSGELNARILAVVSQYDTLQELTSRFNIPFHHIPVDEKAPRESHEEKLLACCKTYNPNYIVLAKYMRILSSQFTKLFPERIINIHHSFLPAFIGANPYRQAYERGVKIMGATAHFVTQDLDEGPIITQSVIPVKNSDGPSQMAKAGRDIEKLVLANALNLVFEDRVLVYGRRTMIFE